MPSTRPADRPVGEQRDAHPAQLARRLALAALERDLRPGERPVDVLVHVGERAAGDQLVHATSEQVVGRHADPVAERLVREPQLQVAVEMDDRRADAVGDQAQPVLAPARLELQPLQLVDVGVADEKAADIAVGAAVRVIVDVDPDRGPPRHRQLPLEPGALAGERRVDIGFVQRKHLPPVDVLDLLPDHVDEDLAGPLEERLVDEAVAPVAVHVGQRQADRVQLPLRQRSEVGRPRPAAGRVLDRAESEPGKGLRQSHAVPISGKSRLRRELGVVHLWNSSHPGTGKQGPGPNRWSATPGPGAGSRTPGRPPPERPSLPASPAKTSDFADPAGPAVRRRQRATAAARPPRFVQNVRRMALSSGRPGIG